MADLGPVSLAGMNNADADRVEREGQDLGRILQNALSGDFEVSGSEARQFVSAVGERWSPEVRGALYARVIGANGANRFNLSPDAITVLAQAGEASSRQAARAYLEAGDKQRYERYVRNPSPLGRAASDMEYGFAEAQGVARQHMLAAALFAAVAAALPVKRAQVAGEASAGLLGMFTHTGPGMTRVYRGLGGAITGYVGSNIVAATGLESPRIPLMLAPTPRDPRLNEPPR